MSTCQDCGTLDIHTCERAHRQCPNHPHAAENATIQRIDLFGNVTDTFQTETELNGHRAEQAPLFDAGPATPKAKPDTLAEMVGRLI